MCTLARASAPSLPMELASRLRDRSDSDCSTSRARLAAPGSAIALNPRSSSATSESERNASATGYTALSPRRFPKRSGRQLPRRSSCDHYGFILTGEQHENSDVLAAVAHGTVHSTQGGKARGYLSFLWWGGGWVGVWGVTCSGFLSVEEISSCTVKHGRERPRCCLLQQKQRPVPRCPQTPRPPAPELGALQLHPRFSNHPAPKPLSSLCAHLDPINHVCLVLGASGLVPRQQGV